MKPSDERSGKSLPSYPPLKSLFIIGRVFRDQIEQQTTFTPICIITPARIIDFDSLHEVTTPDTLKRINTKARENIDLFNKVQAIATGASRAQYYRIDETGGIWMPTGSL